MIDGSWLSGKERLRFLVTGGAGFIGSHIVDALVSHGLDVRVIDDLSMGSMENLASSGDRIELVVGDICDREVLRHAMHGVDIVFHEAALNSITRSIDDPVGTLQVNVGGTQNVLLAARDSGVKRVIYASSSSVYGDAAVALRHERLIPRPRSPYGVHKVTGELLCRVASDLWGLETICLRYFNVFGPRQNHASQYAAVVPAILHALWRGEPARITGDGRQSRDFTYVENVVHANLLAIDAPASGMVMNIGCGELVSVNQLHEEAAVLLGSSLAARYVPPRPNDIRAAYADLSRARERIGYAPVVGFSAGLARTVDAMRQPGVTHRPQAERRPPVGGDLSESATYHGDVA